MIDNKKVIITKENQFDKGWTLFCPYTLDVNRNHSFKEIMINDIVKQITYADEVYLILSEACLSSKIVDEIMWANKYIKLNIIANNKHILEKYSKLSFNNKEIDESIDYNFIGIIGKTNGYYMISDGYSEVDDSLYRSIFEKQNLRGDLSFLNNAKDIILIDKDCNKDYSKVIKKAKDLKIPIFYSVNEASFNKNAFDYAKRNELNLLVSDFTINSIIVINEDSLNCINMTRDELYISYPIEKVSAFLGRLYKCKYFDDVINTDMLSGEMYSCYNGKNQKLNIVDKKVVAINVEINEMANFVNESFDSSIVDNHNDYSAEAKKVEYQFTLIPPLIDKTYKESSIYNGIRDLSSKWNKFQKLNVSLIKKDYNSFMDCDYGLISFLDSIEPLTKELGSIIGSCKYSNYYNIINKAINDYSKNKDDLIEICKQMFSSINKETSGSKFNKFDDEIAGYKQTIEEKNVLIKKGIDVLSNKRRVEILTKKIDDLNNLKKHFESSSNSRNDKELEVFIKHCESLLKGDNKQINADSIGNIVKPKEETKLAKLESFIDKYLYSIKKYDDECICVLDKLINEDVPTDYPVFEKDNQRYIVINNLNEFETTKDICAKFSLKCLARR